MPKTQGQRGQGLWEEACAAAERQAGSREGRRRASIMGQWREAVRVQGAGRAGGCAPEAAGAGSVGGGVARERSEDGEFGFVPSLAFTKIKGP